MHISPYSNTQRPVRKNPNNKNKATVVESAPEKIRRSKLERRGHKDRRENKDSTFWRLNKKMDMRQHHDRRSTNNNPGSPLSHIDTSA